MTTSRRQFLLNTAGASVGAILPSYYFRALQFFEQFGEPLLEAPRQVQRDLYTFHNCDDLELTFGDPCDCPTEMTYREYLTRYEPEGLLTFERDWGIYPEELDELMSEEQLWDRWDLHSGPQARAHAYLSSLDLGAELIRKDGVGGLELFEDYGMTSCWRGVRYDDEVTLSLLQQRLNDLGTGIRINTNGFAV
jgi:hypothetical protein